MLVRKDRDGSMKENDENEKNKGLEDGADFDADRMKDSINRKINYREEEVPDCECIYG